MTETLRSEDKEYSLSVETHYKSSKHLKENLYKRCMNNQETEMKIKYKLHIVIEKYKHKPKQKFEIWKIHNLK